jgi:hypothetical protein
MVNAKILVSGIVALLIIAVALLATQTWNPQWNPFVASNNRIIEKALLKLADVKTIKSNWLFDLTLEGNLGQGLPNSVSFTLSLEQQQDNSNSANPITATDFNLGLGAQGVNLSLKGKTIATKNDVYLMFTSFPAIPFLSTDALSSVKDVWMRTNNAEIRRAFGLPEEEVKIDEKQLAEKVKELLRNNNIFVIKQKLGKEKVDGVSAEHYLTELNKAATKTIFLEVMNYYGQYVPETEKAAYQKSVKDFEDNFDLFWNQISPLQIHFWLANGWIRKLSVEKEFQGQATSGELSKINFKVEGKFFDFNKKLSIKIPQNAKPVTEVFKNIFSPDILNLPQGGSGSQGNSSNQELKGLKELEKLKNLEK